MTEQTERRPYQRRANLAQPALDAAEQTETQAVAPSRRRQRASLGGFSQRLGVEPREGFVRRWVNDDAGRPQRLQSELAYDFVSDPSIKSDVPGQSRIARIVGRKPTGEPMHAYLMETPVEEYAVGVAEKEDRLKPFEEAIKSQRDTTGQLNEAETYRPRGGGSSLKRS